MKLKGQSRGTGGGGQKSEAPAPLLPRLPPFAEFFLRGENFELFDEATALGKAPEAPSGRRLAHKSIELRVAIARLAGAGLTRSDIAKEVGIAESTLYANYFPEIGGQRGQPGRRRHRPDDRTRAIVRALRRNGAPHSQIAEAIGISQPTLRRAYADELLSKRKGTESE